MDKHEALEIAKAVKNKLPISMRNNLKGIDIIPRLHNGMLTIRVYCINQTASEPETYIYRAEEL